MAITFDNINRIIEVGVPATEVSIQELLNAIRIWEDDQANLCIPQIAGATGKEDLGKSISVGVTLKLLNWKVKFEEKEIPTVCDIYGGNLVAVDGDGNIMNPIEPSTNITITKTASSSATIVEGALSTEEHDALLNTATEETVQTIKEKTDQINWEDINFLKNIEGGNWKIINNQMIFYNSDGTLEIARFNLFDSSGNPSIKDVFERRRL